jgi:hypothetical protein
MAPGMILQTRRVSGLDSRKPNKMHGKANPTKGQKISIMIGINYNI